MPNVFMVRHGHAAGSWSDDIDPGLDELGQTQAVAAATRLLSEGDLQILSSPLKRAQETAGPYALRVGKTVRLESAFAEIPSPGLDLAERGAWLGKVMSSHWSDQSQDLQDWQAALLDCMLSLPNDTVIFSHFVAINVAVGGSTGDDRAVVFRPDNGSITRFNTDDGKLVLIRRGDEASTSVG